MIIIYYASTDFFLQHYSQEALLHLLPASMRSRAQRYRRPVDTYNFIVGRLMLRQSLLDWELPVEHLEALHYNEYDKPLLTDLHFNIAHSGSWVACASTKLGPLGIDLEVEHKLDLEHLRSPFTEQEWRTITTAANPTHQLLTYWTQKESILKATGTGLSGLEQIELIRNDLAHFGPTKQAWHLYPLEIAAGVYGALCTGWKPVEVEQRLFELV